MNIDKLSKRLEAVSSYIEKGSKFADIGSDHAYLPCYAIKMNIADYAIAGEVVEGPFQTALQQVKEAELENKISVRKGDGLEVIRPGEVECITIAGMGGTLIASILERGKNKLKGVNKLILQPNVGAQNVRKWCVENGWEIEEEKILEEDQKIYEVIVAKEQNGMNHYELSDTELLMGPFLIAEKNTVFLKKWTEEISHWERVMENLNRAENQSEIIDKKETLRKNIRIVKEVLR